MENQEQIQASTQPELSITDLKNIRAILDVAVRRGAFGASEISGVGAVFDRLNTFLEALAQQPQQQDETAGETPAAQ